MIANVCPGRPAGEPHEPADFCVKFYTESWGHWGPENDQQWIKMRHYTCRHCSVQYSVVVEGG